MSKFSKLLDLKNQFLPVSSRDRILSPFFNFQQEFDNLFQNFYRSLPSDKFEFHNLNISPLIDIIEDENNFKVEAEMPGVDENNIKVSISDSILTIKASKEISKKDEGKKYAMREIGYGTYERHIPLPDNTDIDNAESSFKKGMLWINIPKTAINKSRVRELEIKKQ